MAIFNTRLNNLGNFDSTSDFPKNGKEWDMVSFDEDRIMEKVKALLEKQKPVFVKMTCHNCGAGIYQKADDHIFKCKFCRTTYFVGTEMIRDGVR